MIKLKDKINLVTLTDQGLYDVRIRIQDMSIQDGLRLLPRTGDVDYDNVVLDLEAKEAELAATSVTATSTRARLMRERDELMIARNELMIKDEGVCTCSLRYFAANDAGEILLPIQGVKESFSCFVSELEEFSSMYDNVFLNKKYQMKQRVVRFLADSMFAGLTKESDFIIE
jgi:hypothetical protein